MEPEDNTRNWYLPQIKTLYYPKIYIYLTITRASLVAQTVKNPPAMQETQVQSLGWEDLLGWEDPGGGHGNPLQYSCLENPHGLQPARLLCPWGFKQSHMTEQLSTAQHRFNGINTASGQRRKDRGFWIGGFVHFFFQLFFGALEVCFFGRKWDAFLYGSPKCKAPIK